jgi:hypothetical protein
LNDGYGVFTVSQELGKAATTSVALGDLDNDGDLDALWGNIDQDNQVWFNTQPTIVNNPVRSFSDPTVEFAGTSAQLTRYSDSVDVRVDTAELVPGDAVTLWWAVFNNPEFCVGPCAASDLTNPAVEAAVMYADGTVVGEDGTATFTASLNEGDVSGVDPAHEGLPGAKIGLADASKATVHIVMRTHGTAFPEGDPRLVDQLTMFNGGCNPECTNVQASVFDSPNSLVINHPVRLFSDPTIEIAETNAKLTRYADNIAIRADTAELVPGNVVTLWWAVFNNPEFCVGPCAASDLTNPAVMTGGAEPAAGSGSGEPSAFQDAVTALITLGYPRPTAVKAVRGALDAAGEGTAVEDLVRRALGEISVR